MTHSPPARAVPRRLFHGLSSSLYSRVSMIKQLGDPRGVIVQQLLGGGQQGAHARSATRYTVLRPVRSPATKPHQRKHARCALTRPVARRGG